MFTRCRIALLSSLLLMGSVRPGLSAPAPGSSGDLLSADERRWLDENRGRISLAVEDGYAPFVFVDAEGRPRGLAHDYLVLLEQKLAVQFPQKRYHNLDEIFIHVRDGETHIVNAVTKTPWRSTFLAFTTPFISVPNVIIVRRDRDGRLNEAALSGLTVSLVKSYAVTEDLDHKNLGIRSRLVPDDLTALLDVSFGRADAAVIDLATASYLISEKGITNLRVAGEVDASIRLSMAVPAGETQLLRIVEKGLAAITPQERLTIRRRWIDAESWNPLRDWRVIATAGTLVVGTLVVILGILAWNRALRRQVTARTSALEAEKESLRDSEQRHRALFESAPVGVVQIDPRTAAIVNFNEQACTQLGYSREEFARLRLADIELLESPEETLARVRTVVEKGQAEFQTRQRSKSGEPRDVLVQARFTGAAGTGLYYCLWRDITRDKRNEATLRARLHLLAYSEGHSLDELMREALAQLEELTGSCSGVFQVLSDDAQRVSRETWHGRWAGEGGVGDMPTGSRGRPSEEWNRCVQERKPFIGPSQLTAPIVRADRAVALLGVGDKPIVYTTEDADVVSRFADLTWTIVERKLAQDERRASEARFRSVFDASPLGIIVTRGGRLLLANGAYARMFGYLNPQELVGASVTGQLAPAVRDEVMRWNEAREKGDAAPAGYESLGQRQDGSLFPVQVDPILVEFPDGPATLSFIRDLSQAKQVERALRSSLERVTIAEGAAHVGFWDWDVTTGTLEWSSEFRRLFGLALDAPASFDTWRAALHPDDREAAEQRIRQAVDTRLPLENEYRIIREDGERWISAVGTTTYDPATGRPSRMAGICTDITARKAAEAEKAELEHHLRQAQKMEALGTLAGGIAHDFNNILTPVIAHAELALLQLPPDAPPRDDIVNIVEAAGRAKDLVRQILLMTRRELDSPLIPVPLGPLVNEALKLIRASLPSTIEIRTEIAPSCGPVLGVPSQIHQVLLNLCTNAGHAMEGTGGVLTVALRPVQREAGDTWLSLSIRDTGPGIPKGLQERIFEPYFTTKAAGRGSGLGLAVVHGIVTKMGGQIRVESEEGAGATFEVLLPQTTRDGRSQESARANLPRGRGQHVVLVDDEPALRRVVQRLVESLGYRVSAYGSAADAIEAFASPDFHADALITDYTMPGMTGLDLAIRLLAQCPGLPILLATGFAAAIDADVARSHGLRDVVMKPYDMRRLAEALEGLFG